MSMTGPLTFAGICLVAVALIAPGLNSTVPVAQSAETPAMTPSAVAAAPIGNGFASRELERSSDGHFYAEAQVNGAQIRFLVDTGASVVALTSADAQRAGIAPSNARGIAMGAGGPIEIMPVVIDRVALGPLAATHVSGAVVDDLPVSLLGQSFLGQIGSVRIEGDRMILR
jgi:aspartyl protease family protein